MEINIDIEKVISKAVKAATKESGKVNLSDVLEDYFSRVLSGKFLTRDCEGEIFSAAVELFKTISIY